MAKSFRFCLIKRIENADYFIKNNSHTLLTFGGEKRCLKNMHTFYCPMKNGGVGGLTKTKLAKLCNRSCAEALLAQRMPS
jgi:hypothetical protein